VEDIESCTVLLHFEDKEGAVVGEGKMKGDRGEGLDTVIDSELGADESQRLFLLSGSMPYLFCLHC
jgi:hypothetical protein